MQTPMCYLSCGCNSLVANREIVRSFETDDSASLLDGFVDFVGVAVVANCECVAVVADIGMTVAETVVLLPASLPDVVELVFALCSLEW